MKSLGTLLSFGIGAILGSSITFIVLKEEYDKRMEEEFKKMMDDLKKPSVVNFFNEHEKSEEKESDSIENPKTHSVKEYDKFIKTSGYSSEEEEDDDIVVNDLTGDPDAIPVIIPPDEFGDEETYHQISLLYYKDGVLADEKDHPFRSYDAIPRDFDEHFGEYEDDAVYVRNDRLRIYYEILRSEKTYAEVLRKQPYLAKEDDDD